MQLKKTRAISSKKFYFHLCKTERVTQDFQKNQSQSNVNVARNKRGKKTCTQVAISLAFASDWLGLCKGTKPKKARIHFRY